MSQPLMLVHENPLYHDGDNDQPYLFASVDLRPYGIDHCIPRLPIYINHNHPPVPIFSAVVAGLPLEHTDLRGLGAMIVSHLTTLVRHRQLPFYLFQIGSVAWPIYETAGTLTCHIAGMEIGAASIGELRMVLIDHFLQTGRIQSRKDLRLLSLSDTTMQVSSSICMMRVLSQPDIPVFASRSEQTTWLTVPLFGYTVQAEMAWGMGLFQLYRKAADRLVSQRLIESRFDLTIRKLLPSKWEHISKQLTLLPDQLIYERIDLPQPRHDVLKAYMVANEMMVVARQNSAGYTTLYFGADLADIQMRLSEELTLSGRIERPKALMIVR